MIMTIAVYMYCQSSDYDQFALYYPPADLREQFNCYHYCFAVAFGSYTPYIASRKTLCNLRSNGIICTNKTAVSSLTGSTQNNVLAAPSQKNSPTIPWFSSLLAGGRVRTAKSTPKPTEPLLGSHMRCDMVSDKWLVAISLTVSGFKTVALPNLPLFTSIRANFI